MNTINERIKYLRKEIFKLTQAQFAERIGMKQRSASTLESRNGRVTDRVIRDIGYIFNIREEWLRFGEGSMFRDETSVPTTNDVNNCESEPNDSSFSLDTFLEEHGATEFELSIMRAYFELEPMTRSLLLSHFKSRIATSSVDETAKLEEEYKKMLSEMRSQNDATASNTTGDITPKTKRA